ncbi:MAG: M48 family metallopeptidase [Cyclobacteriaceae bacterium]|nr:M48 family metallopeptidase [Cyclobacteriaceae bacterium]
MTSIQLLYLLVGITLAGYLFNTFLEWLNLRAQRRDIPDDVAAFYDREKYLKSLDYHRDQTRFEFLTSGLGVVVSLALLTTGAFGYLDELLRQIISGAIPLALCFFGIVGLASDLLTLPFQWYAVFVLEERYGFNKTTPRTFVLDKLKGYVLGAVIGGVLMAALISLMERIGPGFWIWFGVIAAGFILFMNMFYTTLILPLFNRLTPLPDGELKSAIETFAQKVGFPLDNIFVMDGSKRSKKANAFFSGIGRKKKIVLYDTLINNHTTEELVAVLAHEVGHFKKKHIVFGYVLSLVQVFFTLFLLSKMAFSPELSLALGGGQHAFHLNLVAFGILFSPISGVTGLLMSLYSRKNEYEADAFARETYSGPALATALKKLSVDTLSNLYPHPVYVFFHYSHPPLLSRLGALKNP